MSRDRRQPLEAYADRWQEHPPTVEYSRLWVGPDGIRVVARIEPVLYRDQRRVQLHASISQAKPNGRQRRTPSRYAVRLVREHFGLQNAEEDNHKVFGRAPHIVCLWIDMSDPDGVLECECKETEEQRRIGPTVYSRPIRKEGP